MNGFIYRLGQRIKDHGERLGHARVFGIHIFNRIAGAVISLGLAIRESAFRRPARGAA
jgi:hypothetical protein